MAVERYLPFLLKDWWLPLWKMHYLQLLLVTSLFAPHRLLRLAWLIYPKLP